MRKYGVISIVYSLLFIMALTHGGGYFIATQCTDTKTKTTCCVMDHCCCRPGQCQCKGHFHKGLVNPQEEGLAQMTDPECSPFKKISEIGFDTTPCVCPAVVQVCFLEAVYEAKGTSVFCLRDTPVFSVFHPPQA